MCVCVFVHVLHFIITTGPVAQWIRHLTTDQGIPGSNPGRVDILIWFLLLGKLTLLVFQILNF